MVVSLGGSILAPDVAAESIQNHVAAIEDLLDADCALGVVTGGGAIARRYITTARQLDANEIQLDQLGVATTRLNARLLIAALGEPAAPRVATDYETAGEAMRRGDVAVMGGVAPGQTTDAVSAALAEYTDADLLVYATSVAGVYSADPKTTADAEKFETLSAEELVDIIVDIEMRAGSQAPVDLLAAKLIQRSGVRAIVLDGTDPKQIVEAVLSGEHDGTDIIPAGTDRQLSRWTAQ